MTLENEIRVLAAIIGSNRKVLVAKRPAHKRHGGLWEFPGGKVDEGESDAEAMARELSEELGLETLLVGSPLWESRDPGSPFRIVFLPVMVRGHPQAIEHEEFRWAAPQELLALPLAPTDRRFVEEYLLREAK